MVFDLFKPIMADRSIDEFVETNDADFAYAVPGVARFRCNLFRDHLGVGAVLTPPGAEIDLDAVRDHVRAMLRGSKTPDQIDVTDELPRTSTGKLLRRVVLEGLTSS